jgi:diguanylate cyclase (GGDEF)-like protein
MNSSAAADTPDMAAILASVGEVPYEWSIDSDELIWGANAAELFLVGSIAAISSGRDYAKLLDPSSPTSRFDTVMKSPQSDKGHGVPYQVQYALRPPGADKNLWIEDTGRWFAGADGSPAYAHGVVSVINERHALEERLLYLSRFDDLTGEMNRFYLTEMLEASLQLALSQRTSCGFMLVSVDNIARINEAYGFEIADEAIQMVSRRLRTRMRGGDRLGRFSGNKFAVILDNCTADDMEIAAERLIAGVRDDVAQTSAGPVAVSVTIGGVTAPRHAATTQEIIARAQETLDRARAKRLGSFQNYHPNAEREAIRRDNVQAAEEIVRALNDRRILLAFEPVVETVSRRTAYFECLMRIRRADGRLILANTVIPIAERLGLIRLLDHRVLELLIAEMAAVPALCASVNVSAACTTDSDWWATLVALLRAHSGVAQRLTVEITESAAIQNLDDTRGFVARVKDLGCRIAIDDFGSGYTSFRNLRWLGADILKIDGSFVQNLQWSEDDRAFVQVLIDLAKRLGLKTVAEWVQDEAAARMLANWGCDYLQGGLVGRAMIETPWREAAPAARRKGRQS